MGGGKQKLTISPINVVGKIEVTLRKILSHLTLTLTLKLDSEFSRMMVAENHLLFFQIREIITNNVTFMLKSILACFDSITT